MKNNQLKSIDIKKARKYVLANSIFYGDLRLSSESLKKDYSSECLLLLKRYLFVSLSKRNHDFIFSIAPEADYSSWPLSYWPYPEKIEKIQNLLENYNNFYQFVHEFINTPKKAKKQMKKLANCINTIIKHFDELDHTFIKTYYLYLSDICIDILEPYKSEKMLIDTNYDNIFNITNKYYNEWEKDNSLKLNLCLFSPYHNTRVYYDKWEKEAKNNVEFIELHPLARYEFMRLMERAIKITNYFSKVEEKINTKNKGKDKEKALELTCEI